MTQRQNDNTKSGAKLNMNNIEEELKNAQAILDNNPVLAFSPGDLKRSGRTVDEYLAVFSLSEQEFYRDYYEDEI